MLHNTSAQLLSPYDAICQYGGCVDLLDYWRKTGTADKMDEFTEQASWCLEEASGRGHCDVLEWFKVASGLTIECPSSILNGDEYVPRRVKSWWAKSGLVDEKQLARINVLEDI
ncbi:hypothetical protein BCR44DRAFT_1443565 [Catenaria anguillulae PL171]|uniref:Uncharacterized protein n=1 Tax=Catenaria anguillulae PL171 TaxID=765915 RepID=A0A1Y2HBA0_9FUNG|nr:hypothetical protein BCR44DRAFT_1443565 [Catenaria anguillulae PL171]